MYARPMLGLTLVGAVACGSEGGPTIPIDPTPADPLPRIVVDGNTGFFATEGGDRFTPWGYNYTTDRADQLVEERWDTPDEWATIEADFQEMKAYGANVVRVHLQFHEFMLDPSTPDPVALTKLGRLIEVAERVGVYLDITGLAAYRKGAQPQWYDGLSESERWQSQAVFWESVAATASRSDNVFAYNLMNEPVVLASPQSDWLPGAGFGGFHFIQSLVRDLGGRNNVDVFREWIALQGAAVRRGDSRHLVTVGFLPLGDLRRFEANLDFLSTHIYPTRGDIAQSVTYTRANAGAKPLLIEEIAPLNADQDEVLDYMTQVAGDAAGFLAHYMGLTADELAAEGTIAAAIQRAFLLAFAARSPG